MSLAIAVVFLLASTFYLWTANTSIRLSLHGVRPNAYTELADAFLHDRLSVRDAPQGLLSLSDPYDPSLNTYARRRYAIHDYALYGDKLYVTWGPVPAIVLMLPARLIGWDPSQSLIVSIFAILGLAFALATLRVILRQIGQAALWTVVAASLTLALCSVVPFVLRRPLNYEEAVAGGYCFAMAGIWLATRTLFDQGAPVWRLALLSLCFGLAVGCRPTLGLLALVLVPVYFTLRSEQPQAWLLGALTLPIGGCLLLLLAYNQARFGHPLEIGSKYQLGGYNLQVMHLADPRFVLPGAWYYVLSPPRITDLFPFIFLGPPPDTYPLSTPKAYTGAELTGGLLPMIPILSFLLTLPWIWRAHPNALGTLALGLLTLAGGAICCILLLSFEFFSATERYEVDFATPLMLGSLAAWLTLSHDNHRYRRRLVQAGGGLLVTWGMIGGVAISFTGYENYLAAEHPGTWSALQKITSPIAATIVRLAVNRPVIADVSAPHGEISGSTDLLSLEIKSAKLWLINGERVDFTVVSPGSQRSTMLTSVLPDTRPPDGATHDHGSTHHQDELPTAIISGPDGVGHKYSIPPSGRLVRAPVNLKAGLNHVLLKVSALPPASSKGTPVLLITKPTFGSVH